MTRGPWRRDSDCLSTAAGRGKGPTPKSRDWPSSRLRPSPQSAAPLPLRAIAMTKGRPRDTLCCLRTPSNVTAGVSTFGISGFAGVTGESDRQVQLLSVQHALPTVAMDRCARATTSRISNWELQVKQWHVMERRGRWEKNQSSAIVSFTSPFPFLSGM